MKKCLVLFAGIPEWDYIKPGTDGWPDSIVEHVRFRHVHSRWRKWLIEKNPDIQFDMKLSWDTSFVSPSGSYLKKIVGWERRCVPPNDTINWIRENCMGRNGYHSIEVSDMSIEKEGRWHMPEALSDNVIYSPNIMPFIRMLRCFQATKNQGYDYFIYARPDSWIKRSLYLDQFENTCSIFTPSDNWGGLFFMNKDFDYMWAGDYEAVQRLCRLFCGSPHIRLHSEPLKGISEKEKFELCAKYDMFGAQFRSEDNVLHQETDIRLREYLIEIENYWYSAIQQFINEGYEFSTTHNHGIQALLKQAMLQPHPKHSRGNKPW